MKFRYQFADETVEIEVTEEWGNVLLDLNRLEYNNNQTETRRHTSLTAMDYEGEFFSDPNVDISSRVEVAEAQDVLRGALDSLLPQQRELVERVYFHNEKLSDIAKEQGVSRAALSIRMSKIYDRLKKVLHPAGRRKHVCFPAAWRRDHFEAG